MPDEGKHIPVWIVESTLAQLAQLHWRNCHTWLAQLAKTILALTPRKCGFTADDVYRCLTYLDENADALVSSMNASLE